MHPNGRAATCGRTGETVVIGCLRCLVEMGQKGRSNPLSYRAPPPRSQAFCERKTDQDYPVECMIAPRDGGIPLLFVHHHHVFPVVIRGRRLESHPPSLRSPLAD